MTKFYSFVCLLCLIITNHSNAQSTSENDNTFKTANFQDLNLDENSFYDGADGAGSFISGSVSFFNAYNTEYSSWAGFSYSNIKDTETPGYTNQFSAYAHSNPQEATNIYGVAFQDTYASNYPKLKLQNTEIPQIIGGIMISNSTFAYHSMKDGDDFAKKFGGETGKEEDFFLLKIYGTDLAGEKIEGKLINFYLADYRFEDDTEDYIIDDWTWVDLSSLGEINGLVFELSSSDNGDYGMNTPAYFCMDELNEAPPSSISEFHSTESLNLYPNPCKNTISIQGNTAGKLQIINLQGEIINTIDYNQGDQVNISHLAPGTYIMKLVSENTIYTNKILIN